MQTKKTKKCIHYVSSRIASKTACDQKFNEKLYGNHDIERVNCEECLKNAEEYDRQELERWESYKPDWKDRDFILTQKESLESLSRVHQEWKDKGEPCYNPDWLKGLANCLKELQSLREFVDELKDQDCVCKKGLYCAKCDTINFLESQK